LEATVFSNDNSLHNIEVERALLGSLLLDNSLIEEVPDNFANAHFAIPLHAKIYETMKKLRDISTVADPMTISSYLGADKDFQKADGEKYLINLVDSVVSLTAVSSYADIIHDLYLRRQIIGVSEETILRAKEKKEDEKAIEIVEDAEKKLYDISSSIDWNCRLFSFRDAIAQSVESATSAFKKDGHLSGVATGLRDLDRWLGGLHNSDLLVIAGRPSMGKTALATNIAFNAARYKLEKLDGGVGVLFFSLEMSAEQLSTRVLASESGVSSDSIRRGSISKDSFHRFLEVSRELEFIDLFIDDTPNITAHQIRTRARKIKRQHDIGLIVIDYLQLISSVNKRPDNRVNEVAEITRALKGIAKELNVPVLALSQLSRAVEQREDKKPQLADLRESGAIEQDADVVMFIYREEYYKARKEPQADSPEHERWQKEMEKIYNLAELIIAKQRNGAVGTINLFFDGTLTRFGDLLSR
jgi:replicative DNA helicase